MVKWLNLLLDLGMVFCLLDVCGALEDIVRSVTPSPSGTDDGTEVLPLHWGLILVAAVGALQFILIIMAVGTRSKRKRNEKQDEEEEEEEASWGIDGVPLKAFADLQKGQMLRVIEKYGTKKLKKKIEFKLSAKEKLSCKPNMDEIPAAVKNEKKIMALDRDVRKAIPTKEEVKARKLAVKQSLLVPDGRDAVVDHNTK